jgi:hypothetical protein
MDETATRSTPWQVYFLISSKESNATLSVDYPLGGQTLVLPVYPSNSVPEALPLLEPGFAHYVAQWEKIMVPDPRETDARGFYLTPADVPDRIADPAHGPALAEIATRHLSPEMNRFFEGMLPVPALSDLDLSMLMWSNVEEVCDPPDRWEIEAL